MSKLAFERYRLPSLIGQGSMGKVIAAAAATMALAPFSVVATTPGVAQAAPCAGVGANPESCDHCMFYVTAYNTANVCYEAAPSRPAQSPPSRVPVPIPEAPPEPAPPTYASPSTVPVTPQVVPSTPPPPSTIPVQSPKINPLAPGAPAAQTPEPSQPTEPWWPQELLYGVLAIAVGLVAWMINRPDTERGSDR